ncbi:MAG: hypothetical protein ABW007_24395 [Chitinophagaceae bacterium]
MNRIKSLAIFNTLFFLAHVCISYMTQFKLINVSDVGEVSDRYESLFTPAGITFAIWGVIYTALGVFCLYHIIMAFKHDRNHPANIDLANMGGWFIFNNVATAAWLFTWTNNQIALSLLLIVLQLGSLIAIHIKLNILDRKRESGSIVCTQWPLSIYLGWISIATIANASIYLVAVNWDGMGINAIRWTVIMIAIAVGITLMMVFVRKNVSFGLVVIWALYGIVLKHRDASPDLYQLLIMTAWTGIIVVGIACIIQFILNLKYHRPGPHFPEAKYSLK